MADALVFYSWQSDLPSHLTRSFIEGCLKKACKVVGLELCCELSIDQDGRGESGSPDIPDVIQAKIQHAVAFVSDLSIVARRPGGGGLTNGCVAIEWGWAEQALGTSAMLGVMNLHFGKQSDLPIDIRQHLVRSVFALGPKDGDEVRAKAKESLTAEVARGLRDAIRGRFFAGLHSAAPSVVRRIVKDSPFGLPTDYEQVAQLAEECDLATNVVEAVIEDLVRMGLARVRLGPGGSQAQVSFSTKLFGRFDALYMGWNVNRDARAIAQWLVENRCLMPEKYLEESHWTPRRLNPALDHLVANELVLSSRSIPGDRPFVTLQVNRNDRTRAFAEGRLHVPSLFQSGPLSH